MKTIFTFLLIGLVGLSMVSTTYAYEPASSTVQTATTFLAVRPGSNKTSSTLTLSQLNSFVTTVKNYVQSAYNKMYDIDYDVLYPRVLQIESQMVGVTTTQFSASYSTYYALYEELFMIYGKATDSRVIDGRGMWHRPFEQNLSQVLTTLQEMKDMSINMLYVETFWLGRLIYPSSVPNTFQHGFTMGEGYGEYGNNLLLAFVEEGKKMGIEVHAWVENFFVGYGTSYLDSPILAAKPQWASINYDYSIPQRSEVNYLFMDPANPEVRRYLKDIYAEIVSTMDVGSIHLDYIRYPVAKNTTTSNPVNNLDTGYSDFAEAEFKMLYNRQGDLRTLVVSNATVASEWRQYKVNVITDFVKGVYYTIKNTNPSIGLSTAIFGNVTSAITEKAQDWATWASEGYIEIITPMSYYQSTTTVGTETSRLTDLVGLKSFSYAGLAPTYMGYNEHLNTTQIQASLYNKALGTVFFASQFYMFSRNDYATNQKAYALEVQAVLMDGVFRKTPVLPHDHPSVLIEAQFADILDKINRIYLPRNGVTQANALAIETEFARLQALPVETKVQLEAFINELKAFNPSNFSSAPARDRIIADRNLLIKALETRLERMNLDITIDISVNPDPDTLTEPTVLDTPSNVSIVNGSIQWSAVSHALRYELVQKQGSEERSFFVNGTSYSLSQLLPGNYDFKVRAIGDGFFSLNSAYSTPISYEIIAQKLATPANLRVEDGIIRFDAVANATAYRVVIDYSDFTITTTSLSLIPYQLPPGTYSITVQAMGNGYAILNSDVSAVYSYVIIRPKTAVELTILAFRDDVIKSFFYAWKQQPIE